MAQHHFTEIRRASTGRKMVRCQICEQEWTKYPRISCPGMPVVPWSKDHGSLRTAAQAKKEHYLLPDDAQPVAALRLDSDPWYIWLYDVSQIEQKLPTEAQKRQVERREFTLRERYGCRMCSRRYLKKEAIYHVNGICQECRRRARDWNGLLGWTRELLVDPPNILILTTEPGPRSMRTTRRDYYHLAGYQTYDLATGELIAEQTLRNREDYATLYGLLQISVLAATAKPLFLLTCHGDYQLFWDSLIHVFGRKEISRWPWDALTTYLREFSRLIPRPEERNWYKFPESALVRHFYYAELCQILGLVVDPDASVAEMLRQVVMNLAAREEIEL